MIKGTIKDYTITTLEELIERKVPRDYKELKVYIHTYLDLVIIGLKWEIKRNNIYYSDREILYIRYLNSFGKEIYKPIKSQFTKQTLWEIVKYLYS
nr:MAG TPA: hypothetical protein [Caudoviricetes sp.]